MKVSDLEGDALDRWVQNASLREAQPNDHFPNRPSSDWSDGGPIIERERISVLAQVTTYEGIAINKVTRSWVARDESDRCSVEAATPLVAAMRCYVASKFGEEVPGA